MISSFQIMKACLSSMCVLLFHCIDSENTRPPFKMLECCGVKMYPCLDGYMKWCDSLDNTHIIDLINKLINNSWSKQFFLYNICIMSLLSLKWSQYLREKQILITR
jgi:hypothetical protein